MTPDPLQRPKRPQPPATPPVRQTPTGNTAPRRVIPSVGGNQGGGNQGGGNQGGGGGGNPNSPPSPWLVVLNM